MIQVPVVVLENNRLIYFSLARWLTKHVEYLLSVILRVFTELFSIFYTFILILNNS